MKAMVIGASGFLGSCLSSRLGGEGVEVYGTWFKNASMVPEDLAGAFGAFELERTALLAPDVVYLCAAHIPYGAMNTATNELLDANVRLPERCRRLYPGARLILASSVSVFGNAPSPRTESSPCEPLDEYGRSKLLAEEGIREHRSFGVVRLSSLYGPGMTSPTFLRTIVEDARAHRHIRIMGDGRRTQDYFFVEDAADLMIAAGRSSRNDVFIGATGNPVSNVRAAEAVATLFPGTEIEFVGHDDSPSRSYDPSWTFRQLDFSPAVAFEAGMERMVRGV